MAFQRLKYRVEPLVPELEDKIADGGLSLMKKVKKEESKDLNDNSPGKVLFYPGYTQNTRTEIIVYSDEVALRKETKPNFVERVAAQEEYMKREAEDAIMSRQRTLMKQRLKDASDAAQSSEAFSKIGMKAAAGGAIGLPVDENDDDDEQNEKYMDEKMKQDRAEIDRVRGIKFARYRMSDVHHGRVGMFRRGWLGFKIFLGFGHRKGPTEILPWLFIGDAKDAGDLNALQKGRFTHIINAAVELKNEHKQQFVYLNLKLYNSTAENLASRFMEAITFIDQVEEARGRLPVHCSDGASRAPAIVIAYLMVAFKISLWDAYHYTCSRRRLVNPNNTFLLNLAELELEQNQGCSVLADRDWRFFEFNSMKAEKRPNIRRPIGVSSHGVMKLYGTMVV